ncbi:FAD-dependent oxidoreductase, partial [Streptomyces sp. DT225]
NDPSDTVPLIGPFHIGARHTYVATGFGGWGMTGGVLAGRLLTSLIADGVPPLPWAELYDPRRLGSAVREAGSLLGAQAEVAKHFVGDRLRVSHLSDMFTAITDANAEILEQNAQRRAAVEELATVPCKG